MTPDHADRPRLVVGPTAARRSRCRRHLLGALIGLGLTFVGLPATAEAAGALNGRLSFTSFRWTGNGDIATMNPDGSDARSLTGENRLYDAQSDWSPDGKRIAYRREVRVNRRNVFQVWAMDKEGGDQRGLGLGSQPAWSPDGRTLLFRGSGPQETDIFAMEADGSNRRLVASLPDDQLYPSYSPSMDKILFASLHNSGGNSRDRGIYTIEADGSGLKKLVDHPGSYDSAPNWSPDGERVAFESNVDGDMEIYVMDADGANVEKLTDNAVHDEGPSWSPDGRRLLFTRGPRDAVETDVYAMNPDGSAERRLTDAPNRDESPDWQPIPHAGDYESCGDAVEEGAGPWSVKAAGQGLSCEKARAVSSRWADSAVSGEGDNSVQGFVCESRDAGYGAAKIECTHRGKRADGKGNDKSILFVWRGGGGFTARMAGMAAAGDEQGLEPIPEDAQTEQGDGEPPYRPDDED